jgi:uncharacterized BrkB/YihY/UPF0761 family membrane protein
MSRVANWIFGFGLLGWGIFAIVTPFVISILFTPPISFGTNCEPAVHWSMSKLIWSQLVGIVVFMFLGLFCSFYFGKSKKQKKDGDLTV